jgi:branched-chain amino acid transport system ATP-binding protein
VLLRADGLTASYGALRALDDVGIVLRGGSVHALVGPNGSGKSTLLKVLAGDLRPGAGTVEIAGAPAEGRSPADRVRAGVARTPQRTVVLPRLTPAEQVAVGVRGGSRLPQAVARDLLATPTSRSAAGVRDRAVAAALRRTGLTAVAHRDPATLTVGSSGSAGRACGRHRRAGAAARRAGAGMTPAERAPARSRSSQVLAGERAARLLLVEHECALVGAVADRVTCSPRAGVAVGSPKQVRADPR